MEQPTIALKEWAIAVEVLTAGKTIILLRKGGIREAKFQVEHHRIWLYSTYEHQKPHLLKPEYAGAVTPVDSAWHPQEVLIKGFADITDVLSINSQAQIDALLPYHVWQPEVISDRLKWKPQQPLTVLLLRVYRLIPAQTIAYHSSYGGCKSWIELLEPLNIDGSIPVMTDSQYQQQVQEIKDLINLQN